MNERSKPEVQSCVTYFDLNKLSSFVNQFIIYKIGNCY